MFIFMIRRYACPPVGWELRREHTFFPLRESRSETLDFFRQGAVALGLFSFVTARVLRTLSLLTFKSDASHLAREFFFFFFLWLVDIL